KDGIPWAKIKPKEQKRTTETRTRSISRGESQRRAEERMLRSLQEERRLRLDQEIRDIVREAR
ncbi:MAG: hypothetical protein R3D31_11745, partial [Hyphomicrobiaceae bacterium]